MQSAQPVPQQAYYPPPDPSSIQHQVQTLPNIVAGYKKGLRGIILRIVIAAVIFRVIVEVVASSIMGGGLFLDGTVTRLASLASTDFDEYARQLMWTLQNNDYIGWGSVAGVVLAVPVFLMVRGKKLFTKDLTRVGERINPLAFCKMLALVLGIGSIATFFMLFLSFVLGLFDFNLPSMFMPDLTPYLSIGGILYAVIFGPIIEEIVFRGAILRSLQPYGTNFALVLSSLLFGMYHLFLFQATYAFFMGLVLAYCTLRFSIKWSMLIHILNNGVSMLLLYLGVSLAVDVGISCLFIALAVVAGIAGLQEFRRQKGEGKLTSITFTDGMPAGAGVPAVAVAPSTPYKIAFSSPWLIVLLTLAFLLGILFLLL
ncbi:MAG: CPBP family intramembrane metalloprotease [Coriobacteriales bacterium]|nr:CPBP family intramembrane metalloprotease [Coriobacteriales bacterium]